MTANDVMTLIGALILFSVMGYAVNRIGRTDLSEKHN